MYLPHSHCFTFSVRSVYKSIKSWFQGELSKKCRPANFWKMSCCRIGGIYWRSEAIKSVDIGRVIAQSDSRVAKGLPILCFARIGARLSAKPYYSLFLSLDATLRRYIWSSNLYILLLSIFFQYNRYSFLNESHIIWASSEITLTHPFPYFQNCIEHPASLFRVLTNCSSHAPQYISLYLPSSANTCD